MEIVKRKKFGERNNLKAINAKRAVSGPSLKLLAFLLIFLPG